MKTVLTKSKPDPNINWVMDSMNSTDISIAEFQDSVLHEIMSPGTSDLKIEDMIKKILISILKVISCDYAQIALFDHAGQNIQSYTAISDRLRQYDQEKRWHLVELCESFWYDFSTQNLRQYLQNDENRPESLIQKNRSWLSAVLSFQNRNLGTLVVGCLEHSHYQQWESKFLRRIADCTAFVIEYICLVTEHHQNLLNFSVQSELKKKIGTDFNLNHVLLTIVDYSTQKMQAQLATVQLMENDTSSFSMIVSDQNVDKALIYNYEIKYIIPMILKSAEPFIWDQIYLDDFDHNKSWDKLIGYKTYLVIALKSKQKVIGILTVYWNKPHQLNSDDSCLIRGIAFHAAEAIEYAKRYQELLQHTEQLEQSKTEMEKFVDTVTHELKMPLASIQGLCSTLLDNTRDDLNEENYHYLEKIYSYAVKTQHQIDDLIKKTT